MNINRTICPFNHRACVDCALYRGRHRCSGVVRNINDKAVLDELERMLTPEKFLDASLSANLETTQIIYLNIEDKTSKTVSLQELKNLDWDSTFLIRKIDGIHIYSWESLLQTVQYKLETEGKHSIELIESPAHMLYGGG